MLQKMVNGSCDELNNKEDSPIIVESSVEAFPVSVQYPNLCLASSEIVTEVLNTLNTEEEPPSPPTPIGSESWQCGGSASVVVVVENMLQKGVSLQNILRTVCPGLQEPVEGWSDDTVANILSDILDQPPRRTKLPQYNTMNDAIELFRTKKRILVLTGAGVSVSCGIPDFRSKNGIYARLHIDFPDLPDPTAMFDIRYFRSNPAPFYNFATEIFPGQFKPSISHRFIHELEKTDQLLRNYTQNIDTLEDQTGITRLIECHGSFKNATCLGCNAKFRGETIKEDVMAKRVARCPQCKEGVIKPDIVFFGEDLAQEFHRQMAIDKDDVDLLVVVGSSLKVRPVSLIPFSLASDVPQILINREPLSGYTADIELLGDCDEIIKEICLALGGPFEKMLRNYYEADSPSEGGLADMSNILIRRTCVPHTNFLKLADTINEERKNSKCPPIEEGEEPVVKKQKLGNLYESHLISVQDVLPTNSYFQLSPNRAVFPGAELFFDVEYKLFSLPSLVTKHDLSDDTDEEDSDDEYNPYEGSGRGGSEPPSVNDFAVIPLSRPTSCEPTIDVETTLSTFEFKKVMEEIGDDSLQAL
ncbi:unnamed protein product [Auanema sp. JU1783]|nr:unnamed protein product [Auanema sp. JU1783]